MNLLGGSGVGRCEDEMVGEVQQNYTKIAWPFSLLASSDSDSDLVRQFSPPVTLYTALHCTALHCHALQCIAI